MDERLKQLLEGKPGTQVDFDFTNGLLRSSKTITKDDDDSFTVCHEIDGTFVGFDRAGIIEVFEGKRSPWEGEVYEDPTERNWVIEGSDDKLGENSWVTIELHADSEDEARELARQVIWDIWSVSPLEN